jgi:gluconate 2-dehydrogenase gamma chain
MADETIPRRDFLKGAVGTAAALTTVRSVPAEAQAATPAAAPASPDAEPLLTLTATEHAFVVAAVDTIIPADELSPSGSDCGVAAFIDRQLAGLLLY